LKDKIVIISSLLFIIAFNAVDCSISPLVEPLHSHFGISIQKVLWFISWGTLGILAGLIIGPGLAKTIQPRILILANTIIMSLSIAGFLLSENFMQALAFRFVFGFSAGLTASMMWWVAFYGVKKTFYQAMIAVLMSGRALSVAFGVPFAGIAVKHGGWTAPFWAFNLLLIASGIILSITLKNDETTGGKFCLISLIRDYINALRLKYGILFYSGFMINRICYFGIYSIAGIWFINHYNLKTESITGAFFYIGLGEALINFFVPWLIKRLGYGFMFLSSVFMSGAALMLFIGGNLPLAAAIGFMTLFVIFDRIYCMAVVITIPDMFPDSGNKTVFGTLNTLTSWTGLALISWFAGKYMETLGLDVIQAAITVCFIVGAGMIIFVQQKTVLALQNKKV
jgi:predicted MFS family arabinose efflux permease